MKKTLRASLIAFLMCFSFLIIPARPAHAIASAVILSEDNISMTVGCEKQLQMLIRNYPCSAKGWKSSNTNIATVNSNGVVYAKKAGTATIYCNTGYNYSLKCRVTVNGASKVELSKYIDKSYLTVLAKIPQAKQVSASDDPQKLGNLYAFNTLTKASPFLRYDKSTGTVTYLYNAKLSNLSLYGVKLNMTEKKAKAALKAKKCTYSKRKKSGSKTYLYYTKAGHNIVVTLKNGKVISYKWTI